jgi:nucleotide-binding universal stress UspA family protein
MYSMILVAVDGSPAAQSAARHGVALARACGASVLALHVAPPHVPRYFADAAPPPAASREVWEAGLRAIAKRHFASVRAAVREQGVALATEVAFDDQPADAICRVAAQRGCDLIVMGSPVPDGGVNQDPAWVVGAVLALGTRPVLLHREPAPAASRDR